MLLLKQSKYRYCGSILAVASVQSGDLKPIPNCDNRRFHDKEVAWMQRHNPGRSFTFVWRVLTLLIVLAVGPTLALAQEGGHVLPGKAHPHGYSLTDMLIASAVFNSGGSNPTNPNTPIPNTPFQILFADLSDTTFSSLPCGGVTAHGHGFYTPFVVKAGTPFYVPLIGADDSPPVLGTFPTTDRTALDYFFNADQLGGQNWVITVDGRSTAVGPEFLAGPVTTQPLPDGGGTHAIWLAVFLTPLSVGDHTIHFSGQLEGVLACFGEDFTYKVKVVPY